VVNTRHINYIVLRVYMNRKVSATINRNCFPKMKNVSYGGSVAEWLACWTQAQKGLGSKRIRDAVG